MSGAAPKGVRTHPCVRLFCIVDTLTSASVLPGIDDIIKELPASVVCADHGHMDNMSSQALYRYKGKGRCAFYRGSAYAIR
jgi:hypothetical protein